MTDPYFVASVVGLLALAWRWASSCFAAGMLLGLPAIFGWALGYRKPPS